MELTHLAMDTDNDAQLMPSAPNPYPCGMTLNLDAATLAQLGIEGLPPAGTSFHLEAMGTVTNSSTSDPDADGDIDYMNVQVQITHLGLEQEEEESPERDHAQRMYGTKGS